MYAPGHMHAGMQVVLAINANLKTVPTVLQLEINKRRYSFEQNMEVPVLGLRTVQAYNWVSSAHRHLVAVA